MCTQAHTQHIAHTYSTHTQHIYWMYSFLKSHKTVSHVSSPRTRAQVSSTTGGHHLGTAGPWSSLPWLLTTWLSFPWFCNLCKCSHTVYIFLSTSFGSDYIFKMLICVIPGTLDHCVLTVYSVTSVVGTHCDVSLWASADGHMGARPHSLNQRLVLSRVFSGCSSGYCLKILETNQTQTTKCTILSAYNGGTETTSSCSGSQSIPPLLWSDCAGWAHKDFKI